MGDQDGGPPPPGIPRANTDWLHDAGWGVFTHYLADTASAREAPDLTPEEWSRQVDDFDVDGLARQLESVGARYYGITIGQNSGFYCSPNATYDRIVGRSPSRLSRRDLIADIAEALAPKGIRLIAYLPSGPPDNDAVAVERLKWRRLDGSSGDVSKGERLADFQAMWESVIREWSVRWGRKVSGWWIDGCYSAEAMYRRPEPPNFDSFRAALKAGNPDAVVAFNPGLILPRVAALAGSNEDYTAGEVDFALPVCGRWYDGSPAWPGRFVDHEQFHVLSFLGEWWGGGGPRFPDEMVVGYTKHIVAHDGAITWDVPVTKRGLIPERFVAQLAKLKG